MSISNALIIAATLMAVVLLALLFLFLVITAFTLTLDMFQGSEKERTHKSSKHE